MNIVFVADSKYIQHLSVAIASLIANNHASCDIFIINSDITIEEFNKLKKLDALNKHKFIDAKVRDEIFNDVPLRSHYSKAAYYKLLIPDLVKADKCLYIDADTVINCSVNELYNTDVEDVFLAAVEDAAIRRSDDLEMNANAKYFNSGVMLINLKKWRETNLKNKVIEFINIKPHAIKYVDQDGLNAIVNGLFKTLHPKYNMQTHFIRMLRNENIDTESKIKEAVESPIIIHYTESSKPWHFLNMHPFKKDYWRYIKLTEYKNAYPEFNTIISDELKLRYIVRKYLPNKIYNKLKDIKKYL